MNRLHKLYLALGIAPLLLSTAAVAQEQAPPQARYSLKILGTLGNPSDSEAHGLSNRESVAGQSFVLSGELHAFFWRKGVMLDIGTLGGPDSFVLVANHTVSEKNSVVGYSETSTPDPNAENFCNLDPRFAHNLVCLGFAWENGVMTPLPTLGGTNGQSFGINNRGQIVGSPLSQNATDRYAPGASLPQGLVTVTKYGSDPGFGRR